MDAKRKAIICDMDKPDENELWSYLQSLPHGEFSEITKQFWKIRMREAKRDEHEMKIKKLVEVGYKHMKESEDK